MERLRITTDYPGKNHVEVNTLILGNFLKIEQRQLGTNELRNEVLIRSLFSSTPKPNDTAVKINVLAVLRKLRQLVLAHHGLVDKGSSFLPF